MSQKVKPRRLIQIWPFFVFFGMGSSISFVYAGAKHKMRNLVLFGVGYGLLFALAIAISEPTGGTAEEFSGTSTSIILGIWIASTTHAFRINKKHRSEVSSEGSALGVPHLPPPSPPHASGDSFESLSGGYFASQKELTLENDADVSAMPVDVNSADLQTLLTRLNLSPAGAEQVLLGRQATGGFGQIEEFVQTAGLKPHEFAKIRNLVVITPTERENLAGPQQEGRSGSGRILDI
jgi:hypothetical protein